MAQLDLFGGLFAEPVEKKQSKKANAAKVSPASPAVANSVVAMAEEVLAEDLRPNTEEQEPINAAAEIIIDEAPAENNIPAISPPQTIEVEEVTVIEPAISDVVPTNREADANPQPQSVPPGSGAIVFSDGKITVKVKAKAPVLPAVVVAPKKQKIKKPPQKRGRKSFKEIDAEVDLVEIPEDEILFQKQYYPISEVAKWFRVNTSLLRYWENEFDILKPRKNRKGDRLFRPEDVKNLQLIYQLLRQRKFTVEGAKEFIKSNKKKADMQLHLTNTLLKFRSFLLELKANLQS